MNRKGATRLDIAVNLMFQVRVFVDANRVDFDAGEFNVAPCRRFERTSTIECALLCWSYLVCRRPAVLGEVPGELFDCCGFYLQETRQFSRTTGAPSACWPLTRRSTSGRGSAWYMPRCRITARQNALTRVAGKQQRLAELPHHSFCSWWRFASRVTTIPQKRCESPRWLFAVKGKLYFSVFTHSDGVCRNSTCKLL